MGSTQSNASLRQFIDTQHASHAVVIWSKSFCPYCTQTKQLFARLPNTTTNDIQVHELDHMPNGRALQAELALLSGQSTVPNVFVHGQHLGGNDATQAAHRSGALTELLLSSKK